MEYRIVKNGNSIGIHKVISENGKVTIRSQPEIEAEDMRELEQKIAQMNCAFWKDALVIGTHS